MKPGGQTIKSFFTRRDFLVSGTAILYALGVTAVLTGCVPGAIVVWTIAPNLAMTDLMEKDVEQIKGFLLANGYAELGSSREGKLSMVFFSLAKLERVHVTLIWNSDTNEIQVKLIESEERLSASGHQQVTLISKGLESRFGGDRISINK